MEHTKHGQQKDSMESFIQLLLVFEKKILSINRTKIVSQHKIENK